MFQWLFDEAQMRADNVGPPVTPQQWNYIHEMGGALRSSLSNVTAVFAPSCIGHAVLSKRDWINIKIDDISLPSALRCWEHATRVHRKRRHSNNANKPKRSTEPTPAEQNRKRHQKHREAQKKKQNNVAPKTRPQLTKEERAERKRLRLEKQKLRQEKRNRRNRKKSNDYWTISAGNSKNSLKINTEKNHGNNNGNKTANNKKPGLGNKKRRQQQQQERERQKELNYQVQREQPYGEQLKKRSSNSAAHRQHIPRVPEKCALRLMERCTWPQCNHSCPTLTNPQTGEELRFVELLTSFGLNIKEVAVALGVDMHTLNNMDRIELVNMLTQKKS